MYTDEEFEEAFKRVDRDSSGFITSNEVEELLYETYGYPALEEEIKLFMDEFDANNDGKPHGSRDVNAHAIGGTRGRCRDGDLRGARNYHVRLARDCWSHA